MSNGKFIRRMLAEKATRNTLNMSLLCLCVGPLMSAVIL